MAHTMQASKTACVCGSKKAEAPFRAASAMVARPASSCRPTRLAQGVATPAIVRVPSVVVHAAASAAEPEASKAQEKKQYYALLANAEFFVNDVQNESMAEQLRERVRFFKEQNREIDFWMVPEPKWLDKYPAQAKMLKRPCIALISSDKIWITFMKLRLDRVLRIDLGPVDEAEALAVGGEIPEYPPPAKWTAPYARYAPGWWNVFVPKH